MTVICPICKSENPDPPGLCKTCGTPIELPEPHSFSTETIITPQTPVEGEKLFAGRYRVLSLLGEGGMGKVYRVQDTRLQEEMALKFLKPEIANNPVFIQRFRSELKLARKITHRNVCRVFDFHEEEGTPYITMEYVKGENLKSLIRRKGKLKEAEAIDIAAQVAEGLAEAHDLGVIHRDLKPDNILIDSSGRVKIMDFGIARSIDDSGLTQTGHMIGTPDYISAEQAAGQPADHRADIYALGILLYEMMTGELPFKGDSVISVVLQHKEKTPGDPREINPEISTGLSSLILCCLEKDRERRCQDARELLENLRDLSRGAEPTIAAGKAKGRWFTGWKRTAVVSMAAIVLIAVVLIILLTQGRSPSTAVEEKRPSLAVVYFENNTGDENLAHWSKAFAELLTTDLSQSKYLDVLSGDRVFKILEDLGQLEASGYSSDVLEQVARKGKVRHILRGSYMKAGSRFRVSISLKDMETGEIVGSRTAEAEGEENLFTLVDDLTRQIKSDMHLSLEQISNDIDREAAEVTTSSPQAYKLYIEGMRHHYRAQYQLCIEFMDKAIAIDPGFASAYALKAWSYDSTGYHKEFVKMMTKAFELSYRVPERERFKISSGYYLRVKNDIPRAKEEFEKHISLYPDDIYAIHSLGFLYFSTFEEYKKSLEYLRRNVENRVEMFYSYYLVAWAEMCLGNYENARDVCERYISEMGDHPEIRLSLSYQYFCRGDFERALVEVEKAAELGKSGTFWKYSMMGGILQAKGDLAGAEGYYREMVGSRNVLAEVRGREFLGLLALLRGRYQESRTEIEQGVKLLGVHRDEANLSKLYSHLAYIGLRTGDYEVALEACAMALKYGDKSSDPFNAVDLALHLQGLCQLAASNTTEARKTAEALEAKARQGLSRRSMKNYLHLAGSIEMEEGNNDNAITYFEKAVSLLPAQNQDDLVGFKHFLRRTLYLASLGKAYFRAGYMDKAQRTFETLTALTIGRHYYGDLYVKAYYWLGKISEEQDKSEEAAAYYRTFLKLWEKADAEIPELSDARARLESLVKNNQAT